MEEMTTQTVVYRRLPDILPRKSRTFWSCGPSEGTLARAVSTTSGCPCQGSPAVLSCRHLARSPQLSTSTSIDVMSPKRSSKSLG
jgi:hypothetical protein